MIHHTRGQYVINKNNIKRKVASGYRRDHEPVNPMLIIDVHDATLGAMPLVEWAFMVFLLFLLLGW